MFLIGYYQDVFKKKPEKKKQRVCSLASQASLVRFAKGSLSKIISKYPQLARGNIGIFCMGE